MYSVGDKITVSWPVEPPVGTTVQGALTMFGYERTEAGWVNQYRPLRSSISWKMLLRDECDIEITSVPYSVGLLVSSAESLRKLPVGTVMIVLGGVVPYVKISDYRLLRYADGCASERSTRELNDVVFQIKYVPKEQ